MEKENVWSLTVCFVPEEYPDKKHPKDVNTYFIDYVPKTAEPGVALDGLIEAAKKQTKMPDAENDYVAWMQLSYHEGTYEGEENPDWSYSYRFRRRTKIWNVKPFEEALEGFRTMVNRKAETLY